MGGIHIQTSVGPDMGRRIGRIDMADKRIGSEAVDLHSLLLFAVFAAVRCGTGGGTASPQQSAYCINAFFHKCGLLGC